MQYTPLTQEELQAALSKDPALQGMDEQTQVFCVNALQIVQGVFCEKLLSPITMEQWVQIKLVIFKFTLWVMDPEVNTTIVENDSVVKSVIAAIGVEATSLQDAVSKFFGVMEMMFVSEVYNRLSAIAKDFTSWKAKTGTTDDMFFTQASLPLDLEKARQAGQLTAHDLIMLQPSIFLKN